MGVGICGILWRDICCSSVCNLGNNHDYWLGRKEGMVLEIYMDHLVIGDIITLIHIIYKER